MSEQEVKALVCSAVTVAGLLAWATGAWWLTARELARTKWQVREYEEHLEFVRNDRNSLRRDLERTKPLACRCGATIRPGAVHCPACGRKRPAGEGSGT